MFMFHVKGQSFFRYRTLFCVTLIPLIFADHFRKFCLVFPTKVRNVIIFHLRLSAFSARTNHAFSGLPAKVYGREIIFQIFTLEQTSPYSPKISATLLSSAAPRNPRAMILPSWSSNTV